MDASIYAAIFSGISVILNGAIGMGTAYLSLRKSQVDLMAQQIHQIKANSDSNRTDIIGIARQGQENADAIEGTRIQNVRIAERVEVSLAQNDELASNVGHLHICVETKVGEVKEAVERVPDAIKEAVPAVIKDVVPEVIAKELPKAVKATLVG